MIVNLISFSLLCVVVVVVTVLSFFASLYFQPQSRFPITFEKTRKLYNII